MKFYKKQFLAIFMVLIIGIGTFSFVYADTPQTSFDKKESLERIGKMIDYAKENYYGEVDEEKILKSLLKSTLTNLDDYSYYMDEEEAKNFIENVDGNFYGIGVQIQKTGKHIKIVKVFPNGPAYKKGILENDLIVSINDIGTEMISLDKAVSMIRGEKGTSVKLGIKRENMGGVLRVDIIREEIKMPSLEFEKIDGIGVIRLYDFSMNALEQFNKVMEQNKNIGRLIIDLRGNPGGLLNVAVSISDSFLPEDKIITTAKYKGRDSQVKKSDSAMYPAKLAILIDKHSASASEIFAGAIKDNQRGIVIGEKSYGKASIQAFSDVLKDGSLVKLTVGEYLLPNGESISKEGIIPNIVIDSAQEQEAMYPMNSLNVSRRGSYDIDTYGMQQRLNLLGYQLKIDGKFGKKSETALKDWQSKQGLNPTGVLDVETKIKLMSVADRLYTPPKDIVLERAVLELKKMGK